MTYYIIVVIGEHDDNSDRVSNVMHGFMLGGKEITRHLPKKETA
jgi:hypothetical protein